MAHATFECHYDGQRKVQPPEHATAAGYRFTGLTQVHAEVMLPLG